MIQIVTADGRREREVLQAMRARAAQAGAEINRAVAAILEDVRENGYPAVAACSRKFDGAEPYEIAPERLEAACAERGRNQAGSPVFESEPMAVSSRRAGGGTAQNGRGTLADDGEKEP